MFQLKQKVIKPIHKLSIKQKTTQFYEKKMKKNQHTNNARTSNNLINNSWSDEAAVYAKPPVKPISRLIEVQLWCSFGFAQPSVDPHSTWRRTVYLHIYILQEMLHTRGNDINEWVYLKYFLNFNNNPSTYLFQNKL